MKCLVGQTREKFRIYFVMVVNRESRSNARNECERNCAPNHGNANNGGVSLSLFI